MNKDCLSIHFQEVSGISSISALFVAISKQITDFFFLVGSTAGNDVAAIVIVFAAAVVAVIVIYCAYSL